MNDIAIVQIPISELIPYANNTRIHSHQQVDQIANSIREFGFTNPVLIDETSNIIAGHGRVLAAKLLGITSIPCIRLAHLTEQQKRAYIIADNKIAQNSTWDVDKLAIEVSSLMTSGFDTSLTGFDNTELDSLISGLDAEFNFGFVPPTPAPSQPPYQQPQQPPAPSVYGGLTVQGRQGNSSQGDYQPPMPSNPPAPNNPDYVPNYLPDNSRGSVTAADVKAAEEKLANQHVNKTADYLVVNCPHCAGEFSIAK